MSYNYYSILALIPPDVSLTFTNIVDKIKERFARIKSAPNIIVQADRITLQYDQWALRMYWATESNVLEESRDIAQKFAIHRTDAQQIALCDRRIETSADPDPEMTYFNDYVYVLEVLASLKGIFVFDPYNGSFIDMKS